MPDQVLQAPSIGTADKLGFTVFAALALHAMAILGLSFDWQKDHYTAPTLEITLAQFRSDKAPDKSDYLAQFSQLGSGTLVEKKLLTTTEQAVFQDNQIQPVQALVQLPSNTQPSQIASVTSIARNQWQQNQQQNPELLPQNQDSSALDAITELSAEIASLEAAIDKDRQAYANRPRIKRLTSASTKRSVDAAYLHSWRKKIEAVGNDNYPKQARDKSVFGNLRLLVALYPNGTVKEIEILNSSGQPLLDNAAIRIVRMAAPFDPFPDELRKEADILEIIRTWRFQKNNYLASF